MAAKGRGSFPLGFLGLFSGTKFLLVSGRVSLHVPSRNILNPVNGSIATNLTLFFCEIAFFICISTWWTIKNPLQQAFSWLYPSFWSHKRQVAGHRYKRGLTQISWCLTKFRWNMVKYSLMTVKSSSTEAIYLLCIYPQVVPTDLFRLMEEILQQKKVEIKTKNQPFPEKKLGRLPQQKFSTAWKKQLDHQIPSVLSPSLSWFPRCLKREGPWLSCWPHPWFGMRQHPASKWHQIAKWSFLKAPIFFYKKMVGRAVEVLMGSLQMPENHCVTGVITYIPYKTISGVISPYL